MKPSNDDCSISGFLLQILFPVFFICLSGCRSETPTLTLSKSVDDNTPVLILVNSKQNFQTIENFGVSGAWWAKEIGGWQTDNVLRVIDLLFSVEKGIGLSAYRYNIGAGGGWEIQDPWHRTESFEISQGVFDWGRDSNAVRILRLTKDAGVNQFIAFAFSPPPRLTRSGMVSGAIDGRSNLGLNQEAAFARYLIDITSHLRRDENIPIGWISPVYEPEGHWNLATNQEGCHYTPEELEILISELQKEIKAQNLDISILLPESARWNTSIDYMDLVLGNSEAEQNPAYLGFHSNQSSREENELISKNISDMYPGVHLWMTEWTDPTNDQANPMGSAITLASKVNEDLTLAGMTAWQYGIAVSKDQDSGGLLYIQIGSQMVIETKKLWALGNYSRFVRPGSRLILSRVNSTGLITSAYISPGKPEIILVVVNPLENLQTARLELNENWYRLDVYETSNRYNLEKVYSGVLPGLISFPGSSVSTLVISP